MAAQGGDMAAMMTLADFYEKGVGVGPDRRIAENLRSAAGVLKSVGDEKVRAFFEHGV